MNVKDEDGKTPFDWFINTETDDLLRKLGAKTGEVLNRRTPRQLN